MPKTRGAETRQACSRFTGVNSREFVRNSHEFRTNFVRISYEFHVNSREFIQISPLCTPSFVLTPGVPPPQCTPAGTLATCNMCTCVWVCLCVGCVDLCGFVYGCMVGFACGWMHDFLFVSTCEHASVCWCVWGCGGHPTTYAHKPVPNLTPTPTHPHTQPRTRAWLNLFALTIRALGRSHLAEPASRSHRKAVFQLNSQIPLRSTQFRVDTGAYCKVGADLIICCQSMSN